MEKIVLHDMDKLLSPTDQAKMVGILKEPEQLQKADKNKYLVYGIGITSIIVIAFVIVVSSMNKKEES